MRAGSENGEGERERERKRESNHSKLEKLEQLEKLEKPERECHVSMETWWGNSASGLAGSISSRLLPCSNVNVLHIFPSQPRQAFSLLVHRRKKEKSSMAEWRSEKPLFSNETLRYFRVVRGSSPPSTFVLITQFPFRATFNCIS